MKDLLTAVLVVVGAMVANVAHAAPATDFSDWKVVPEPSDGNWTFSESFARSPSSGFGSGGGSARLLVACNWRGELEASVVTVGRPSYGQTVSKESLLVYWNVAGRSGRMVDGTTEWFSFQSTDEQLLAGLRGEQTVWLSLPSPDAEERVVSFPLTGSAKAIRAAAASEQCRTEAGTAIGKLEDLYEELQTFKDDEEFRAVLYGRCCKYFQWKERVEALDGQATPGEFMEGFGILPGELVQLGRAHANGDRKAAAFWEAQIRQTR